MKSIKIFMLACTVSVHIFAAADLPAGGGSGSGGGAADETFSFQALVDAVKRYDGVGFLHVLQQAGGLEGLDIQQRIILSSTFESELKNLSDIRRLFSPRDKDREVVICALTPKPQELELLKILASCVARYDWISFRCRLEEARAAGVTLTYDLFAAPVLEHHRSLKGLMDTCEQRLNEIYDAYDAHEAALLPPTKWDASSTDEEYDIVDGHAVPKVEDNYFGAGASQDNDPKVAEIVDGLSGLSLGILESATAAVGASGSSGGGGSGGGDGGVSFSRGGRRLDVNAVGRDFFHYIETGNFDGATTLVESWLGKGLDRFFFRFMWCSNGQSVENYIKDLGMHHPAYAWFVNILGSDDEKVELATVMSMESNSASGGGSGCVLRDALRAPQDERGGGGGGGGCSSKPADLSFLPPVRPLIPEECAELQWTLFDDVTNRGSSDALATRAFMDFFRDPGLRPYKKQILMTPLPEVTDYRGTFVEYVNQNLPGYHQLQAAIQAKIEGR